MINQMLRDLDQREAAAGPRQHNTPQPVPPGPASGRTRRLALWSLTLIAALLAVVYVSPRIAPMLVTLTAEDAVEAHGRQAERDSASAVIPQALPPLPAEAAGRTVPADPALARSAVDAAPSVADDRAVDSDPGVIASVLSASALSPSALSESSRIHENSQGEAVGRSAPPAIQAGKATGRSDAPALAADLPLSTSRGGVADPAAGALPVNRPMREAPPVASVAAPVAAPVVRVRKVAAKAVRESAADVYATALMHLNEGQLQEAEASLRHALALDRTHGEARRLLVMLLLNGGERLPAIALLDEGLDLAPDATALATLRGRLLLEDGDLSRAIRLLERQRAEVGDDMELLSLLGSVYQQARRFAAAVGIYRRITERQPDNARALAGLAIALEATGAPGEALPLYRTALALDTLPAAVNEYARQRVSALSVE
nr:tetratricopeptide repeat protein [Sedimenticola hydrogenitrophicus]